MGKTHAAGSNRVVVHANHPLRQLSIGYMDMSSRPSDRAAIIEEVRKCRSGRVKVAVADMDGILRGKCINLDKFLSAADSGLAFNVFGYDLQDKAVETAWRTGRRIGFGDATVLLDFDTYRTVPWDDNAPFFLGEFVKTDGSPHPLCPRQVFRRVLARAKKMGFDVLIGSEYEFFNFNETPESWAGKKGGRPDPISHGLSGYSLLEATGNQEYFNALWDNSTRFGIPLESLHTETGPGVYEAVIRFGPALAAADRAVLFKEAAKEIGAKFEVMPSFMAKWHAKYPGCSGHIHQSLADGNRNVFHDAEGRIAGMSRLFESYVAGQIEFLIEFGPMIWPTVNSYKRLVEGFWAPVKPTWSVDNRAAAFRVLPSSPEATRIETRFPGADTNAYLAMAAVVAAGLAGIERNLELTASPVKGENEGAENVPRTPRTLIETTSLFRRSDLARDWFGEEFVSYFAATREWEWELWLDAVTDWERRRYFEVI
jgi:glutamine synthetase